MVESNGLYLDEYPHAGMPFHNPLYARIPVCFRGNFIKAEIQVNRPETVSNIVPKPLRYTDNKIYIVFIEVTELKAGFSDEDKLWNEMVIQIPVIHAGEKGLYVCDNYSDNIYGIISGREVYGYPKGPGKLVVSKSENTSVIKLLKYNSNSHILEMSYALYSRNKLPGHSGEAGPVLKLPKIILFKYIPSAVQGNRPEVKQLITTKYGKPTIHEVGIGSGEIALKNDAPDYLKEFNLGSIEKLSYIDMETKLVGGEILYNYL